MSKIFRDIPIEKQIARHMQWCERRREEAKLQAMPALHTPARKFGPFISVSREAGSRGNALATALAEKLHWQLYDREILEAIAGRIHVREELVARFDEHLQSGLDTYMRNLFTNQILDNSQYLYHLTRVLLGIAQYGEAVIVGRGAHLILPGESGVRVRVVAPHAARVQWFVHEHGCTEKRAAQLIADKDKEQREFLQRHFHIEPDDPRAYDVVINAESVTLETATMMVARLAEVKLKISLEGRMS